MNDAVEAVQKDYLSAQESMHILGVRPQTLYAYVSRGWVRSITQLGRKNRLYLREDIERLKARSLARSGHGVVAASAMNCGEPIIATSITEITPEGPRYRGRLAVQLVRSGASFESVAELLWTGLWHDEPIRWRAVRRPPALRKLGAAISPLRANDQLLEIFALFTLQLGMSNGSVTERVRSGRTLGAAREIIQTLTGCFGYASPHRRFYSMRDGQSVSEGLLRALAIDATDENREAMEALLVLFADHELSPGAFAARVAASGGAALSSCIASAICTTSGAQTGRRYDRVEEFLARAPNKGVLIRRARQYQERGSAVPGFGHPLYPNGDPRCQLLLEIAQRRKKQSKRLEAIFGFIEDASARLELHPRHELAATAVAIAMGLPEHCTGALFTLARLAGWVAHVQEQRLSGLLLRPRAKFVRA